MKYLKYVPGFGNAFNLFQDDLSMLEHIVKCI